jgi:hypothetical protein
MNTLQHNKELFRKYIAVDLEANKWTTLEDIEAAIYDRRFNGKAIVEAMFDEGSNFSKLMRDGYKLNLFEEINPTKGNTYHFIRGPKHQDALPVFMKMIGHNNKLAREHNQRTANEPRYITPEMFSSDEAWADAANAFFD